MYEQVFDPVSSSLGLSAIFAALPLITLFVMLGGFRITAWISGLVSLAVAIVVAIAVWDVPVGQSLDMGAEGAAFGFFPILWIVINAVWIYNLTEKTGHFAVLRRSFAKISDDKRIQAVIIAFAFGALIEGLAGFGTPVAITTVMLMALGFSPIKSAALSLIGNTAPVAFGSIATPIVTLSAQTDIPIEDLGAMVGRQTPFLALIVPLVLVGVVDGARGVRQTWPAAVVAGVSFAIAQFVCSNYISVELTDIFGALVATVALVAFLRVWKPSEPLLEDESAPGGPRPAIAGAEGHNPALERSVRLRDQKEDSTREKLEAYAPYMIIVGVFCLAKLADPIEQFLFEVSGGTGFGTDDKTVNGFDWPGLDVIGADGEAPSAQTFAFSFFDTPGTVVLFCGLLTMAALRVKPGEALRTYVETLNQLKLAIVTVMAVLGLAYVMNLTGMTTTLGRWVAGSGDVFAFLSAMVGWLGVAITGSDTSSNALFGALQVEAAKEAGLSDVLLASANSSGGVLGKMISPQNLAIAAAAVGMAGKEGDIFRRVLFWSVALTLVMCVIVYLQSTAVLSWMVV
ncbi:MAG TPA: L-lactate permease [Thermoleophilaceae bacterium]|nr:L-lactate permease [Thermoleophilaceae bacterium]